MASSFDVTANVKLNSANLNANAKKIELALGRITGQASEFQKSLDASTARVFAFGATTAVLNTVNQAFRKLVATTIEVEKRLIEINSIFQASDKVFNQFRNSIFKVAKDTGQSFSTVAEGAGELARQGLSAEETAKRLKASLVLTRISGLGAEKSVKALTAAINGFASASLSAEQIVNKLVAVDTAFAVSAQDLAEAFSRAGSTAEDAGVSFNELLGLVTAVEQKTARGGAVIGNAFKSIFTRLSRGDTIDSLKELGVQIDATQTGIQKLSALSEALTRISDPTVASQIKELAGGVFQINVVSAALKDLSSETSIFQNAATVAANATNEAFQKNAELNKSIAAQINALVAGLTSLAERIGSITFGPLLENLLGLTTKFTEFLDKALDPEKGNTFIKALFKTIGNFLSGPAVVVFTAAFVKIFGLVAKFAKDGLKAVFSIGSESAKIKNIESGIVGLLQKDKQLRNLIASSTASQAQKEAAIINAIRQENSLLTTQAALMNSIASSARAAGVASFSANTGKFGGKKGRSFAGGFQQEEAMARMLGASNNVKAHFGQGTIGGRRFIMNSQEREIPRFGGGTDSAVIPMYPIGNLPNGRRGMLGPLGQRADITTRQGAIDAGYSPSAATSRFGKATDAEKSAAKTKASQAKQKGVLTLNAKNIGLLAAMRGGKIGPAPFTLAQTLSDKSRKGVGSLVGRKNIKNVQKVEMINLRSAAIQDSKPNFAEEFRPQITSNFADPLFDFTKKMVSGAFKGLERRQVTGELKKNKQAKLFSKPTEGGIFESALKMLLAGVNSSQKFSQPASERAPFDFEETGRADSGFLQKFFGDKPQIIRADAKREANPDAARSFISKILRDGPALKQQKGLATFQGRKVKGFAGGHIPKYARGSSGGGGMGALGAVFAADMALNTFNASVVEAGGEVSEFSKGLSKALIVISSLTALSGLGIGKGLGKIGGALGLGKAASSVGRMGMAGLKTAAAPIGKGLGFLGSAFMGSGLGKTLFQKRQLSALAGRQRGLFNNRQITASKLVGKNMQGPLPANFLGKAGSQKSQDFLRNQMAKRAAGQLGKGAALRGLGAAGPVGAVVAGGVTLGTMIGAPIGNAIAGQIDKSTLNLGGGMNRENAGRSNQLSVNAAMRQTKGAGKLQGTMLLQKAQERMAQELDEARKETKNHTVTLHKRTLIEERFAETVKKGLEVHKRKTAVEQEIARAESTRFKTMRSVRNLGIGMGAERSATMARRASLMGRLTLPEGPRAMQTEAGRAAAIRGSTASNALMQKIALEEQLRDTQNPEARAELEKQIADAGEKFKKAVEDGSIDFQNRLTSLSKQLTDAEKNRANLVRKRNLASVDKFGAGAGNESAEKAINRFEESLRKLAKRRDAVQGSRSFGPLEKKMFLEPIDRQIDSLVAGARNNPLLQGFAEKFDLTIQKVLRTSMVNAMATTNQDPTALGEASQFRGLSPKMKASVLDQQSEAGTNLNDQIAKVDINIANINETITNTETALKDFSKLFDTDEAKGISANIDKMAKGLDEAAKGLIGVPDATSALSTATTKTVELAAKAQEIFTKVDKSLDIQDVRITNLRDKLATIETQLNNQ
jgi:TP901 family phage tail tape measure protein